MTINIVIFCYIASLPCTKHQKFQNVYNSLIIKWVLFTLLGAYFPHFSEEIKYFANNHSTKRVTLQLGPTSEHFHV